VSGVERLDIRVRDDGCFAFQVYAVAEVADGFEDAVGYVYII
jgi:hypothetical protein